MQRQLPWARYRHIVVGGWSERRSLRLFRETAFFVSLVGLAALVLFPPAWMVTASIRPNPEIFLQPARWIPPTPSLEAYQKVFTNAVYIRYFLNSYFVAFSTTFLCIFLATLAAYGMSRFRFRGERLVQLFIVGTQLVPPISLVIPFFVLISQFGLYDTYPALILTYASFALPLATLMLANYFATIPVEIEEAALIDGCSRVRALWEIVFPLSRPGIIATGVYAFLLSWHDLLFVLTLTKSTEMRTAPLGIALLMTEHAFDWNVMMAVSIIASIPLLVGFAFAQRYLSSGLSGGAVKL
jgi:multiple sugar transport system permease protein